MSPPRWRVCGRNAFLDIFRIQIQRDGIDIHKYRNRSSVQDGMGDGNKSEGWQDHLVAFADAQGDRGRDASRPFRNSRHAMPHAHIAGYRRSNSSILGPILSRGVRSTSPRLRYRLRVMSGAESGILIPLPTVAVRSGGLTRSSSPKGTRAQARSQSLRRVTVAIRVVHALQAMLGIRRYCRPSASKIAVDISLGVKHVAAAFAPRCRIPMFTAGSAKEAASIIPLLEFPSSRSTGRKKLQYRTGSRLTKTRPFPRCTQESFRSFDQRSGCRHRVRIAEQELPGQDRARRTERRPRAWYRAQS